MPDKYNNNRNYFRHSRIAAGLCRDCGGKRSPDSDKVICYFCDVKRKTYGKRRHKQLKLARLCSQCRSPIDNETITICQSCVNLSIQSQRNRRKENKLAIIQYFGGKCKHCSENDVRVLTLDHVNNDGYLDKKSKNGTKVITPTWYAKLVKSIKTGKAIERELQLLCFNCHAKKDLTPWWL